MDLLLDSLFNGVAIGSVLLVAALGLAIVFGLMGVINLAHGELMMLGAYTTYVTQLKRLYRSNSNLEKENIWLNKIKGGVNLLLFWSIGFK